MTPRTNILLNVTGQSAAVAGHWFTPWPDDPRTHHIIDVTLKAGTATWNIEGKNDPNDDPTVILSASSSGAQLVAKFKYVRINVVTAAGAQIYATIDKPAKDTGA